MLAALLWSHNNPCTSLYRFKNSKQLKDNTKYEMSTDDDTLTLTIPVTEPADKGPYRCEASNKLGRVETQCTLTVHGEKKF